MSDDEVQRCGSHPTAASARIWQATVRGPVATGNGAWGGRDGTNSISDAEQLLCLLLPATKIPIFRPGPAGRDRATTCSTRCAASATRIEVPRRLVEAISDYFQRYTARTARRSSPAAATSPRAEGGEPTKTEQQALDIVDSFAISVTLTLATIGFIQGLPEVPPSGAICSASSTRWRRWRTHG